MLENGAQYEVFGFDTRGICYIERGGGSVHALSRREYLVSKLHSTRTTF